MLSFTMKALLVPCLAVLLTIHIQRFEVVEDLFSSPRDSSKIVSKVMFSPLNFMMLPILTSSFSADNSMATSNGYEFIDASWAPVAKEVRTLTGLHIFTFRKPEVIAKLLQVQIIRCCCSSIFSTVVGVCMQHYPRRSSHKCS